MPFKIFVAYIGNDYGMAVARFVDECLFQNEWVPRVALEGTNGYFFAIDEHQIIEEATKCDGVLAINSEGAINRKERLKFWIEVSKLLFVFYKPTVALIQEDVPTLHYLDNPEVRRVRFRRGEHSSACEAILKELEGTIQNWALGGAASETPLGEDLPVRDVNDTT